MPLELLLNLAFLLGLLGCSAFFSGSETAIFALDETELEQLERSRRRGARQGVALARKPYHTLATLLLANMVVNVLLSTVTTVLFVDAFGARGLGFAIPSVTIALLLFGEILPKTLGLRHRLRWVPVAAPLLGGLTRVLGPLSAMLERLSHWISGTPPVRVFSREELGTLVDVAREEGELGRFEAQVLGRIVRFSTIAVDRVSCPRVDVQAVPVGASCEEAALAFERSGFNRLPVYEDNLDHVVGVLYLKDLLTKPGALTAPSVKPYLRKPFFVPESKPVDELFRELQSQRLHFAVVVGEHGGMEGIVTMEDLLEELVGEIRDESDTDELRLELDGEGMWRADAGIDLDDLGEAIGADLEEGEEAVSLGGLMEDELGRVPRVGDSVRRAGFEFKVLVARPNRPLRVRVRREGDAS